MLSNLAKFILGFFIGIFLLMGSTVGIGYFLLSRLSTPPQKPIFAEERIKVKPNAKNKKVSTAKNVASSTSKPTPTPTTTDASKVEPGLYKARVIWNGGLSLRQEPNIDSERVGGVGYNETLVVLEESSDKKWQRVRLENGEQVGWIKSGNVEKVDSENTQQQ